MISWDKRKWIIPGGSSYILISISPNSYSPEMDWNHKKLKVWNLEDHHILFKQEEIFSDSMLVISKTIDLECKLTRFRVLQVIHLGRNTSRSFGRCLECCRDDGGGAEKNLQNGWMDGKDGFSLESPTFILAESFDSLLCGEWGYKRCNLIQDDTTNIAHPTLLVPWAIRRLPKLWYLRL